MERLHRFIARCGVCSRRNAEVFIAEGRVRVNGVRVTEMGTKVSDEDVVEFDGQVLELPRIYVAILNKPKGVVTTLSDPEGRRTVLDVLPDVGTILKPVGRLDQNTTGILICTNDGDLAARLAHPRYRINKEYRAIVRGEIGPKALERLRKGIVIEGRRTAPAEVEFNSFDPRKGTSMITITIHEGRNRQVRLMCEAVGHPVTDLERTAIGFLRPKGLAQGQSRLLSKPEVDRLRKSVGLE